MLKELYDAEATSGGREFQSLRTEGKNEYIKLFVLTESAALFVDSADS